MSLRSSNSTPCVALVMGDPAGIGPEITAKALQRLRGRCQAGDLRLVAVGAGTAFREATASLAAGAATVEVAERLDARPRAACTLLDIDPGGASIPLGQVSAAAGDIAYRSTAEAVRLVEHGVADAIVTAPLNKEALFRAGHRYAGYTDMLARLTGSDQAVMMLSHDRLKVSHVTTHVALRDVPALVTPERLERVIRLTEEALVDFDITRPRIGVASLNPHAGEGRNFGDEDDDVVIPVIERLRLAGVGVEGPVPGDTVFVKALGGQYDAVVAMYHDQGHVPVKLLGFKLDPATGEWLDLSGVNITLGLPVIRTSVDHGTAFDIAGKGIAKEGSLLEAVDVALRLVNGRRSRAAAQEDPTKANSRKMGGTR